MIKCPERWRAFGFTFVKDARISRLMDVLFLTPLLIASGILYTILPWNVRIAFIVAGIIVGLWNGIGILLEDKGGT